MGFAVVLGSACAFKLVNAAVTRLPVPPNARRNVWKWRNISTSLLHSLLTGAWSVLSFYGHPEMINDLISTHSVFSYTLVSVSTGYFIYDFLDMALNQKLRKSWELLFHHSVVISCFGIALASHRYVGFAVTSLLVELNSVFLHLRQLMRMAGRPTPSHLGPASNHTSPTTSPTTKPASTSAWPAPSSSLYSLNSVLTLGTFVVFRITTLAWMTRWLAKNHHQVPLQTFAIGSVGLSVVAVMNVVLFGRLLHSDFLRTARKPEGKGE